MPPTRKARGQDARPSGCLDHQKQDRDSVKAGVQDQRGKNAVCLLIEIAQNQPQHENWNPFITPVQGREGRRAMTIANSLANRSP